MPGGKRGQVDAAAGEDHDLPDDGNPQPPLQGRSHVFELVRSEGTLEQAVVQPVLNRERDQERGEAEP